LQYFTPIIGLCNIYANNIKPHVFRFS
jgi:hypothetical protein